MTLTALVPSSTQTARRSAFFARAFGGALAGVSVALLSLCLGCGNPFANWCLVEGDVDGAPAQAQAEASAHGTIVRLSPSVPDARDVVVTMPDATLETLPLGEQPESATVTVTVCDAIAACVPVRDVVLEVIDLGDGTARATYTGTTLDVSGREIPAEGSFVFVRGQSGV